MHANGTDRHPNDTHRLFIEVNNAQPVSLIDMPDMANAQEKVIITEAAEMLRMEYPNMFKVGQWVGRLGRVFVSVSVSV